MSDLLNWADKRNSVLLADFIAKYGAEYCLTAEEINQMRDAVNAMAVIQQSTFMGTVIPANTPSGTGNRFWFTVTPGTYTNHGGLVVSANSLAIISVIGVVWSISQTVLNLTEYAKIVDVNKINAWTAKSYLSGDQVNHLGKDWVSNAATVAGDVPGTSIKWVERLNYSPILSIEVQKNKFNINAADNEAGKYQDAGGYVGTIAAYYLSGYMAVKASTWYYPSTLNRVTFFDSNKTYISGIDGGRSTQKFQTPSNCVYARMTFNQNPPINGMLEEGTFGTTYEPFIKLIPKTFLSPLKIGDNDIENYAISREKTNFFEIGKNKFNKNAADILLGHYVVSTTGATLSNASYNTTGYVPVTAGLPYSFWTVDGGNQYAWYDSNKVYISGTTAATSNNVIAPVGAYYIRFSVRDIHWENFQIEQGIIATSYVAYEIYLKSNTVNPTGTPLYNNTIVMPSKIHLLKGAENSIYYQAITKRNIPNQFYNRIVGTGVLNFDKVAKVTPPTTASISLVSSLYDGDFNNIKSLSSTAVVGDPANATTAVSLLAIGDSFTDVAVYLSRLLAVCPNFTLVGTNRRTNNTSNGIPVGVTTYSEGRSGWALNQYFTTPFNAAWAGFSPFLQPVAPYTYYGNTRSWIDWLNVSGGYIGEGFYNKGIGVFSLTTGYKITPTTNDVMYVDANNRYEVWNGSAWVVITSGTLGLAFNFTKYRSTWGIAKPTFVSIMLGMNDFRFSNPAQVILDFPTWKGYLDTIITSVFADGITKFAICLPLTSVGMMDNQAGNFVAMQNACLWEQRRLIIENYDNREGEGIYIVDTGSSTDPVYGFNVVAETPFSEYTGTKTIDKTYNQPHPNKDGYNQMGTRLAAFIQALR